MDKELIKIAKFLEEAEEYFEDELLKLAEETKEKAKLLNKIKAALGKIKGATGKVKASIKAHPVKWGLGAASTAAGVAALATYLNNKKKRKELEAFLNSIEE